MITLQSIWVLSLLELRAAILAYLMGVFGIALRLGLWG